MSEKSTDSTQLITDCGLTNINDCKKIKNVNDELSILKPINFMACVQATPSDIFAALLGVLVP